MPGQDDLSLTATERGVPRLPASIQRTDYCVNEALERLRIAAQMPPLWPEKHSLIVAAHGLLDEVVNGTPLG